MTDSFVDTALTLSRRVLSNGDLLELLLKADEADGADNPFNHYTKLQLMVSKARSDKNIHWVFNAMYLATKSELSSSGW